jgi:O-antigen/teichoic acid export membrane protein
MIDRNSNPEKGETTGRMIRGLLRDAGPSHDSLGRMSGFRVWMKDSFFSRLSNKHIEDVIITLADQGLLSATNFITGIIVGRSCSKEEFGLYMLGNTICLYLISAQHSFITSPYTVFSARLEGGAFARYTGSTLIHQLCLTGLVVIVLGTGGIVTSYGIGPEGIAPLIWALVVAVVFIMLREYVRRVNFASLWMRSVLFIDSSIFVLQIGGLFVLAQAHLLNANRAYLIAGTACALVCLAWLIVRRNIFDMRLHDAVSDLRPNWSFGKWVFSSNITLLLGIQLYPWFIATFRGTGVTGVFAACTGLVSLVNPIAMGIDNILGPKAAQAYANGGVQELSKVVKKATSFYALLMLPLCLFTVIFGDKLIVLMYGDKYGGHGIVVSLMAIGTLSAVLSSTIPKAFWAMGRADLNFKIGLFPLVLTLTCGLWMVRAFGLLGAGLGLLLGNLLTSAMYFIGFKKLLSFSRDDKVPFPVSR